MKESHAVLEPQVDVLSSPGIDEVYTLFIRLP